MAAITATHMKLSEKTQFITAMQTTFGPIDVLGRFFLAADAELKKNGITLHFGTFNGLSALNAANRDSWHPLTGTFDPGSSLLPEAAAFCLMGVSGDGEVVATHSVRLFPRMASLVGTAENLSLFYEHREFSAASNETCEVAAPSANKIRGRVAWSGAGWHRPDYRGKGIHNILPRIARAYALTLWNYDYIASFMTTMAFNEGRLKRNGFAHAEPIVRLRNTEMGNFDCMLLWMTSQETVLDVLDIVDQLKRDGRAIQFRHA